MTWISYLINRRNHKLVLHVIKASLRWNGWAQLTLLRIPEVEATSCLERQDLGPSPCPVADTGRECQSSNGHLLYSVFWRGSSLRWGSLISGPWAFCSLQVIQGIYTNTDRLPKTPSFPSHMCSISFPLAGHVNATISELSHILRLLVLWRSGINLFKCLLKICEWLIGLLFLPNMVNLLCTLYRTRNHLTKCQRRETQLRLHCS